MIHIIADLTFCTMKVAFFIDGPKVLPDIFLENCYWNIKIRERVFIGLKDQLFIVKQDPFFEQAIKRQHEANVRYLTFDAEPFFYGIASSVLGLRGNRTDLQNISDIPLLET